MKQLIKNYALNATAKTITLSDFAAIRLDRLQLITDVTTNTILYNFADASVASASVAGNVITLSTLPGNVANSDALSIIYDTLVTDPYYDGMGALGSSVPNAIMRDACNSLDSTKWNFSNAATSDLIYAGGGLSASASWIGIVKSALVPDTYTEILSQQSWPLSVLASAGLSLSQRMQTQEFAFDLVGVDSFGNPITYAPYADIPLANGTAVSTGTVMTYTTAVNHGLVPGDTVVIYGAAEPRVNYGPITVTSIPTATTFTVGTSIGAASYVVGANAMVRIQPPDGFAQHIVSQRFVGTSANNIDALTKSLDRQAETVNWNPGNNATQEVYPSENGLNYSGLAYTYAQRARQEFILRASTKNVQFVLKDIDASGSPRSTLHRSHNIPNADRPYKIRFRARNMPNLPVPMPILAAVKTGTTTATLTIPGHGLTTFDWVAVQGIQSQTNFANSGSTVVTSVIDADHITVAFGATTTASSFGGFVTRLQGATTQVPATTSGAIQNFAKTADGQRLTVTYNASQGTLNPGEIWTLYGLVDSTNTPQTALWGRYRVELSNTTTFAIELTPLDGQSLAGVSTSTTSAGGALLKNSELRIHFVRSETANPQNVEVIGGNGDADQAAAIPVNLNSQAVNILNAGVTTAGLSTQSSQRALGVTPSAATGNADRATLALTSSGNSGTIGQDFGANVSALVNVSAVSGTNPTLDVVLQESHDNGTTWQDTYWLPRITATGTYALPPMLLQGRRRWNYIVGGTSPSFTFGITVMQGALPTGIYRSFADRVISPNSLSSTSTFNIEGCSDIEFIVDMGAITTTAPVFQLEGSENGSTWRVLGTPVTPTANAVTAQVVNGSLPRFIRARTTTAGAGATLNVITIKGK